MQGGTIIQKFQTHIRETSPPVLSTASCIRVVADATSTACGAALTTAEKLLPGCSAPNLYIGISGVAMRNREGESVATECGKSSRNMLPLSVDLNSRQPPSCCDSARRSV